MKVLKGHPLAGLKPGTYCSTSRATIAALLITSLEIFLELSVGNLLEQVPIR